MSHFPRRLIQLFLFSLILNANSWAKQQQQPPQDSAPPNPPSDAKGKGRPQGQAKDAPIRMEDTDAPPAPSSPEEDMEVAEYYIHKGDSDAAIPRLQEAIQLKSNWGKPRLMLAEIYEKRGDAPDAVKCYREYLKALPTAPDAKKIQKKIEKLIIQ